MLLTIRTLSCPPPDIPQNIHAQFGAAGGRIGRSPPCTLILPDPNRHISREHAEIRFRDNVFSIKVVSKVNSVLVNDAVVGPGEAVQLSDGDQILIGEYLLRADIGQPAAMAPAPDALFSTPVAPPLGSPFDVFDNLAAPRAAPPPAEIAPDWFRPPAPVPATPAPVAGPGLDEFFNPTADASRFSDVLHSHPPTSVPDVFAPPPMPAAPVDNRLDQFLGLTDPLAPEPGAGSIGAGADLYRASPLDLPLTPAALPVTPPVAAPLPPNAFSSHDDIFRALEQDLGAFAPPPPALPVSPAVPEPFAFEAPPLVPPPPPPPAEPVTPGPAHEPFDPAAGFALPPGTPVAIPTPGGVSVPAAAPGPVPAAGVPYAAPGATPAMPFPAPAGATPFPAPAGATPFAAPAGAAPFTPPPFPGAAAMPPDDATGRWPDAAAAAAAAGAFPAVPAAPVAAPLAAAAAPTGAAGEEARRLMQVLTEALGLNPGDLDESDPEQTIRLVGELLRKSTDGLFRMLEMRSQLKSELHIEDRTMIASRENNPLKHADTARDAIAYLVDLRQHGNKLFMPPGRAVDDTVWDICAHEMAVMAGTRAALLAALKMFSPDVIEGRIKKTGALENVLPALHKSRLWERFLGMYAELQHEAEDHFDRLLNQEFSKAYSEQSKKLKKKR